MVICAFRLTELGEIAVNLPHAALPAFVQHVHLLSFIGALGFVLVLVGVAARRKQFSVVDVFFISYLAVLLAWPYYDPRYWLPVIPLLIGYCALALKLVVRYRVAKSVAGAYLAVYFIIGLAALASNTSLSYADRSTFGDVFPVGAYRSAYCAASYCKDDHPSAIDPDVLHLLATVR